MAERTCSLPDCNRRHHARGLCHPHYVQTYVRRRSPKSKRPKPELAERLWQRFERDPDTGCWNWTGNVTNRGYSRIAINHAQSDFAYRVMYRLVVGPIPDGLEVDHVCRNKLCVNPTHPEPVTHQENVDRYFRAVNPRTDTHCRHGHEWTTGNTYIAPDGSRACRACWRQGRGPSKPREPWKHGTTGGYNNHRCRCDACREAWNAACREYKRRRRAQSA